MEWTIKRQVLGLDLKVPVGCLHAYMPVSDLSGEQ